MWVYPGFPTLFWGLSVFFVGDLMGKALWKLVENAARFPRRGGRVLCVHGAVSFHRARPCGQDGSQGGGPCVMSSWTAASSDCSRPVNNYVHVKTADLYRPNARLTPERQGYQVLTPFGKLGYSPDCFFNCGDRHISKLGGWLNNLRTARNQADYDLDLPFDREICDTHLEMARRAVMRFEGADPSTMRAAVNRMKVTPARPRRRTT